MLVRNGSRSIRSVAHRLSRYPLERLARVQCVALLLVRPQVSLIQFALLVDAKRAVVVSTAPRSPVSSTANGYLHGAPLCQEELSSKSGSAPP
jgi:hypothetical protein